MFGNTITTVTRTSASGDGTTSDDSVYNFINQYNGKYRYWKNGVYVGEITPSNTQLRIYAYGNQGGGVAGSIGTSVYNITYNYESNRMNVTISQPSNNVIQQNPINFSIISNTTINSLKNITLFFDDIANESVDISNNYNITNFSKSLDYGVHTWKARVCDTDNNCNITQIRTITAAGFNYNSENYTLNTSETSSETFILNITGYATSGILYYNGTAYIGTKTISGSDIIFTSPSIQIPTVTGITNKNFYWNIDGTNTTAKVQTINPIIFSFCNSTNNVPYMNFTFQNEETSASMNATISSSFVYYLGDGTYTKTYSFVNTSENRMYGFCFSPSSKTIYVTPSLLYSSSSAVARSYNVISPLTLTNTTTNKLLYLLNSSSGLYSSYQIVTETTQVPIQNALVAFYLNNNLVESRLTDGSGIVTAWLNPNIAYTITVTKSGFDTFTTSIVPSLSTPPYSIALSRNQASNVTSYTDGITATISPTTQYLNSSTSYSFTATISSIVYALDRWGFNITSGNTTIGFYNTTSEPSGGTYTIVIDTANYSSFTLGLFWGINGTNTTIYKSYTISPITGTEFSIYNGIIDLRQYVADGIFGLTPMGFNIIIFIIIFFITGIMAYKFALTSPATIAGVLWVLVILFDVVFGLIYYDPGFFASKVPHFATVFIGILTIALIIRETTSY